MFFRRRYRYEQRHIDSVAAIVGIHCVTFTILTTTAMAVCASATIHPTIPLDAWSFVVANLVCVLYLEYRCQRTEFHFEQWTTSLIHAVITASLSSLACFLESSSPPVATQLHYMAVANLVSYLISDLANPNKMIFVIHHIVTIAAGVLAFAGWVPVALVSTLALAEWTVPWLYCAKKKLFVPVSYVGLLLFHIIFRLLVPLFWMRPAITAFGDSTVVAWPIAGRVLFWTLWNIYLALQIWWFFTMLWLAYRMLTTKRAPIEHDEN